MEKWSDQFLDDMRHETDSLADSTVGILFEEGGIPEVNALWDTLLHNDGILPAHVKPEVLSYLKSSAQLPAWANRAMIERGEEFFMTSGLYCLVSLLCASLPECYVMKNGATVLSQTHELGQHAVRRLFETAQMVIGVMHEGGLTSGAGGGIRTAQKVRLMHAAIRRLLLHPAPEFAGEPPKNLREVLLRMTWDAQELGQPINQEDMAYTLLTFSYVTLRSLKKLGINVSTHDEDAYLHCWNVVGFIMGVDRRLMADNFADAETLFKKIKSRQGGYSTGGAALTSSLEQAIQQIFEHSTGRILPKWFLRPIPVILMRQLLDCETETMLGLKPLTVREWIGLHLLRLFKRIANRFYDYLARVAGKNFGARLVEFLTKRRRGGQRPLFHIPEKLITCWQVRQPGPPPPPPNQAGIAPAH